MKIIYANPIFLDYRIPLFKRLDELFHGEFYLLYSPKRYKQRFPKVLEKMKATIPSILNEFNGDYLFNTKTKSFSRFSYEGRTIPFTIGLIRTLRKLSPVIVITEGFLGWTPYILIYCILFRRPMYIHYERTCHTERNASLLVTWQRKIFDKFASGYLVNGTETVKYLQSIGVSSDKIHIAGMSADTSIKEMVRKLDDNDRNAIREKFAIKTKGLTFLYVGRISRAKGVDKLIDAWITHTKTYPQDILLLVGDGELLAHYQLKNIESLRVLGRIDYDEIYKLYAIADVFVIATLQDNWSLVVPEAMSCGIPIATSIYNGCHTDLIEEGKDGFTFNPMEHIEIVETLEKFHNSNLSVMGRTAIEMEKTFSIENSSSRIFNILNRT